MIKKNLAGHKQKLSNSFFSYNPLDPLKNARENEPCMHRALRNARPKKIHRSMHRKSRRVFFFQKQPPEPAPGPQHTHTFMSGRRWGERIVPPVDPERIAEARETLTQKNDAYRRWLENLLVAEEEQRAHEKASKSLHDLAKVCMNRQRQDMERERKEARRREMEKWEEKKRSHKTAGAKQRLGARRSRLELLRKNRIRQGSTRDLIQCLKRGGHVRNHTVDFSKASDELKLAFYRRRPTMNSSQTIVEVWEDEGWQRKRCKARPQDNMKSFIVTS